MCVGFSSQLLFLSLVNQFFTYVFLFSHNVCSAQLKDLERPCDFVSLHVMKHMSVLCLARPFCHQSIGFLTCGGFRQGLGGSGPNKHNKTSKIIRGKRHFWCFFLKCNCENVSAGPRGPSQDKPTNKKLRTHTTNPKRSIFLFLIILGMMQQD